jgi:CRP/FNR family transcriptional regulator, cyclic AMP receptor protein
MFKTFFGLKKAPEIPGSGQRVISSSKAELAARLLTAPTALMQLSLDEALVVVSYMRPRRLAEGTVFIHQGDDRNTDDMMLLLDGEVMIESIVVSRTTPITITVLGPGSLIGEMGLIDGEARSATCTAMTKVRCLVLNRTDLQRLLDDDPRTAAKLMMAVSLRIAVRLRETAEKVKLYVQLTQAMQQEIDRQL